MLAEMDTWGELSLDFKGGSRRVPFGPWKGESLGNLIAFDTETALIQDREIPRLALATASDGSRVVLLKPQELARFLVAHKASHWLAHNAQFDFWAIERELRETREATAQATLWGIAGEGRLHDTMLLDMLLRLAHDDSFPEPRNLGELSREYLGLAIDKSDPFRLRYGEIIGKPWEAIEEGFLAYAARDAIATAWLFRKQTQLVERYQERGPSMRAWGPLTESLQVRAAIALAAIERQGLALDRDQLERMREALAGAMREHEAPLDREGVFKRYKAKARAGELKLTPGGSPQQDHKRLAELLGEVAQAESLAIPLTEKTQSLSLSPKVWQEHRDASPIVAHYVDHAGLRKLSQFFEKLEGGRVFPRYRVMVRTGRTSCTTPNIQQLPRSEGFREIIIPSPGHLLLAIDYSAIELRTLALECESRYGRSQLAEILREGVDPHAYTASLFEGVSPEAFASLPNRKELRQRAKALNFGVPGGLGAKSLAQYARQTYGVPMSEEEARAFRSRLIESVYPELAFYLAEDAHAILASNLKCEADRVRSALPSLKGLRSILSGSKGGGEGLWLTLEALNENPRVAGAIARREGSEELERSLLWGPVRTQTGRVRGRVAFTQACNTPFSGLAADGAKLALFELIRQGFCVVAFIHDEFLIELPLDCDHATQARRIESILIEQMQRVCPGLPIACEYALMQRWQKGAEARFEGGRLLPW